MDFKNVQSNLIINKKLNLPIITTNMFQKDEKKNISLDFDLDIFSPVRVISHNKYQNKQFFNSMISNSNIYNSIFKLRNLIKDYNKKRNTNLTVTQYFELITKYKNVNPFYQNIKYNFNKYNNIKIQNVNTLLEYAFRSMSCLISKPVYMETPKKIVINLFYFIIPTPLNSKVEDPKLQISDINKQNLITPINIYNNTDNNNTDNNNTDNNYNSDNKINNNDTNNNTKIYTNNDTDNDYDNNNDKNNNKKNIKIQIATSYRGIPIYNKAQIEASLNGISIVNKNTNTNIQNINKINLFKNFISPKNINKFNKILLVLSNIFKKEVELDLIELKKPYFDDNILVKAIGIMSKQIPVRSIFNYIYNNSVFYSYFKADDKYRYDVTRSFLSGIKIKIGGRLMTQKVIPKISSRTIQKGSISPGKVTFLD